MRINENLTVEEARAFKARQEHDLGPGWCVDVYQWKGRWMSRAYRQGKRGPKPGTKYHFRHGQPQSGTAASQ